MVDTNGDGVPDFVVFNADLGLLTEGVRDGRQVAVIRNVATRTLSADFYAVAPTDSSTLLLPVLATSLGVTRDHPRFAYTAKGYDRLTGAVDALDDLATFNAFQNAISTGQFATVPPNAVVSVPFTVNAAEAQVTPPKGIMIVTPDNKSGRSEATLLRMKP